MSHPARPPSSEGGGYGAPDAGGRGALPTLLSYLCLLPEGLTIVLMGILATLLFLQVLTRYFFSYPLEWSLDVIKILFIWVSLLGVAIAYKRRAHMHVSFVGERLPPGIRRFFPIFGTAVAIVLSAVLLIQGWISTEHNIKQVFPLTGISVAWLYLALPVAAGLMILYSLGHVRDDLRHLRHPVAAAHGPSSRDGGE